MPLLSNGLTTFRIRSENPQSLISIPTQDNVILEYSISNVNEEED
jgi:hypothetical protein